jgi:hypothetical protein
MPIFNNFSFSAIVKGLGCFRANSVLIFMFLWLWRKFLLKGIGEPPLLTSVSVFCAIKEAVAAARSDVGLPLEFRFDSPATVSRILLATRSEWSYRVGDR